jgi:hypothetical protein
VQNGTIGTNNFDDASIQSFGNGWYRISVTNTTSATTFNDFYIHPHSINSTTSEQDGGSFYVWGAQVEALSYATSYIPTYGSTVTRATETLTGSGNSTLINSTEGVLYAEIAALTLSPQNNLHISISNGSNSDRIYIYLKTNGTIGVAAFVGGSLQFGLSSSISSTNMNKIAAKWKQNDFALWVNGIEQDTNTSGIVWSSNQLNILNFSNPINADVFYGKCKALAVFNEALSDDELELLTGVTNYGSFGELASANGYTII